MQYPNDSRYKQWLRSSRWQQLRLEKLTQQPWCEECLRHRRRVEASEVHHRQPVLSLIPSQQESMMFSLSNLMSLCPACHKRQHDRHDQRQHQQERAQNRQQAFIEKYGKTK